MNNYLHEFVAWTSGLYLRMPVKPFRPLFRKIYREYINVSYQSPVKKKIDGINYELDLREVIDNAMYFNGSREPATSLALKRLCKKGNVVIDVGANVGSHTLPMAKLVGENGKVYAFEPVPWAVKKLKQNLSLNMFTNIILETIALSDESGEMDMKFRASFKIGSASGVGLEGKIDESWWGECEQVKVHMETLDNYVSRHNIDRIDLVKLDVDGFEGKVIRGAMSVLARFKPILIMEVAPAWVEMRGDKIQEVLNSIEKMGYKFYKEIDFSPITNLSDLIENLPMDGGFNVLASVYDPCGIAENNAVNS